MAEAGNFKVAPEHAHIVDALQRSTDMRLFVDIVLEPMLRHTDRRLRTAINDFQQMQGQARALERLIDLLTVKPQAAPVRRPVRLDGES